ncbi:uncharacterized protein LOC121367505 [Gigantopelta aegis]|uniref:uncharacterized protein LOC121367505 n=1 Tax=Gigantopelta aegis TaxID=1735272 RepID=UPI001B88C6FA|nr:uncharacterized protein LOC121367505 [Gigantopelta aegis]
MGNQHGSSTGNGNSDQRRSSAFDKSKQSSMSSKAYTGSLIKLFEKIEITSDAGNSHPGEISQSTFENVFHGPLHKFGKLMYRQMLNGHSNRDRITKEQFVKAGKEILKTFNESDQQKYYFKLFAAGKDVLTQEDALLMIQVSYALTLSASKFPYTKSDRDDRVFTAMVTSMFGIAEELNYESFVSWLKWNCPHMFCGVHNWVYLILTGSTLPSELETAPVPQLEGFVDGRYCLSMGMLWAMSATLPAAYTHGQTSETPANNPLITSYHLIMKLARLSRCQSWTMLYNSSDHGLSMNRFTHHVTSYHGPSIMLVSFEGRNLYCVANDTGWRDGPDKYGGEECMLLQISPVYRVIQSGEKMMLWNVHTRGLPMGIQIGKMSSSIVLSIPHEFDSVSHYGVACTLNKVEVWGCGGSSAKDAQTKQKQWEAKDVQRCAQRKLNLESKDWNENPDKQILDWAGIKGGHSYQRE